MIINEKKVDAIVVGIAFVMIVGLYCWSLQRQPSNELHIAFTPPPSQLCTSVNGLPDPKCTPGAINPDITQANIGKTICNKNWSTSSIRPPVSYTNKLKAQQMVAYNLGGSLKAYEEDHLISLELGGSPKDPNNLWPEAYAGSHGARVKDQVENLLHKKVCNGQITLEQAQKGISVDWTQYLSAVSDVISNDEDDN